MKIQISETIATHASPAAFHLPERQATTPADCALRGPGVFSAVAAASIGRATDDALFVTPCREGCDSIPAQDTDGAFSKAAHRGVASTKPSLNAAAHVGNVNFAASEGNSGDPTRQGQVPGVARTTPGHPAEAFVDAWISPRPKVSAPRDFTFKAVIGEPSW